MVETILTLYELSRTFTKLYKDLGFDVIQVDKQIDGQDVRLLSDLHCLKNKVVGIISHPPCTHFAGSGARWWKDKTNEQLIDGLSMVDAVLRIVHVTKPRFWFIENPVGRLVHYLGRPQFIFNPCDYAGWLENPQDEAYTKKTCLWGEFRIPTKKSIEPKFVILPDGKRMSKQHYDSFLLKGEERSNARSRTPLGFARAFTEVNR